MPRRKKHGASLGMKRKGYWKSFPSMAGNNENNKNVINNDETMAAIDGYFNNPAPDLAQNNNEQNDNNDTNNDDKSVMSDNDDEVENVDETVQKNTLLRFIQMQDDGQFFVYLFINMMV